jgi:hypothetical protein
MPRVRRQTRTDHVFLRSPLEQFDQQRAAVRDRAEVRDRDFKRIDREARTVYTSIRATAAARITGGGIELRDVARLTMSARVVEFDGVHLGYSGAQIDELPAAAGIARQTGPVERPDAVPGIIAPLPAA